MGHFCQIKTFELLASWFFWAQMQKDATDFFSDSVQYVSMLKELLQMLGLPKTQHGFDSVMGLWIVCARCHISLLVK